MPARIITLTSIPSRFGKLEETLVTLLNQTEPVDEIRLYLPRFYRRFPNAETSIPNVPKGVRVIYVDEDMGPATKVLYAAHDLAKTECQILFCDDDRIYHPTWSARLLREQNRRPGECIAGFGEHLPYASNERRALQREPRALFKRRPRDLSYRMKRLRQQLSQWGQTAQTAHSAKPMQKPVQSSGYVDLLFGCAGAVIRPWFLGDNLLNVPEEVWWVDDIWLSGRLEQQGIPIWVPEHQYLASRGANDVVEALYDAAPGGLSRAEANQRAIRYLQSNFGVWC